MAKKERLQLTFSMSSPLQRQAWELLCAVPKGERTREICRAVCQLYNVGLILDDVRNTVRDELRNGNYVPVEKVSSDTEARTKGAEDADELENVKIADGYMAFLSSLDDDDNDDVDDGDSDD